MGEIVGKKFDYITVIKEIGRAKNNEKLYLCKCDCGNQIVRSKYYFNKKFANPISCGCVKRTSKRKHNMAGTRIYKRWLDMKHRCYGVNSNDYKDYGGRGIVVCDEWLHDFNAFYKWSIENGYTDKLSLDRIDVNGNYEPDNCRWTTAKVQAHNRRNTIYVTYHGETLPLSDLCERYNVIYSTVSKRYKRGWDLDRCLFAKPFRKYCGNICNKDVYDLMIEKGLSRKEFAKLIGRSVETVSNMWRKELNPKRKAEILNALDSFTTPEESGAEIVRLLNG